MKIKRQKKATRILKFFQNNFGHRHPFQVLIDGTFCHACLTMKINIRDQLPKYLGEVKLLTTKCCILEVEKLGPCVSGAAMILKQFPIHKCGHEDAPKPALKCLRSMLQDNNPQRYFVATQDTELRARARKVPGTPVMYLHHCAPTLEKPSEMSSETAQEEEDKRMNQDYHTKVVAALKRKEFGDPSNAPPKKRRKKGPNPLSCLKKKPRQKMTTPKTSHASQDKVVDIGTVQEATKSDEKKRKRRSKKKKKKDVISQ